MSQGSGEHTPSYSRPFYTWEYIRLHGHLSFTSYHNSLFSLCIIIHNKLTKLTTTQNRHIHTLPHVALSYSIFNSSGLLEMVIITHLLAPLLFAIPALASPLTTHITPATLLFTPLNNTASDLTRRDATNTNHGTCTFHLTVRQDCVRLVRPDIHGSVTVTRGTIPFIADWNKFKHYTNDAAKPTELDFDRYSAHIGWKEIEPNMVRIEGMDVGGRVRFSYGYKAGDCAWGENAPGKDGCGRCNVSGWTAGELGCEHGPTGPNWRTKDMDCEFRC